MARIAKLLFPALLAGVALALPGSASAAARCADAGLLPAADNVDRVETATLCLLNVERRRRGRPRLSSDRQLARAARAYSAKMVRMRFFDHVCPQGSTLTSRVRGGTSYLRGRLASWSLGENIAWGSGERATPQEIVRAWMRSP
ncbi:MAG TPA: CAP domain-containing protein, partial [Solirubrobacteraceae bacterium]|nr:CAP domain-containing protein [Solirubrobacteraceae bacterium]